jgi:hypothetical protein
MMWREVAMWVEILRRPVEVVDWEMGSEELATYLLLRDHRPMTLIIHATATPNTLALFQTLSQSSLNSQTQFLILTHPKTIKSLRKLYPTWFILDDSQALAFMRFTKRS